MSILHLSERVALQGKRAILKDCCEIMPGTVLPADTVVPPFARFAGNPGRMVSELPECTKDLHKDLARNHYVHFVPKQVA